MATVKGRQILLLRMLARCRSVNMVLNVHRNHEAYQRRGEWDMEARGKGDYIPIATLVTARMTPALRWAAMRVILMFQ